MNRSELKDLKDDEQIVFDGFYPFIKGKEYTVKETDVGKLVYDEGEVGQFLATNFDLHCLFTKKKGG